MGAGQVPLIDYDAPDPPHRQIAAWLRDEIASGRIEPGRKIPSEAWLMQAFGVARTTVRRSVAVLREQGLITTVQGRGSYAAR
ncbi:MAG: GntR family transcriptional regulator [Streptosporangiaceae bacterium]